MWWWWGTLAAAATAAMAMGPALAVGCGKKKAASGREATPEPASKEESLPAIPLTGRSGIPMTGRSAVPSSAAAPPISALPSYKSENNNPGSAVPAQPSGTVPVSST